MNEKMMGLLKQARADASLRAQFLKTRQDPDPMSSFCQLAAENGCPISVSELFCEGQEYSDALCRAASMGNPYPYEYMDDPYEMFFAALSL